MFSPRKVFSVLAGVGLLAASTAAFAISFGDANYVGLINDNIPSNPANEIVNINNLIALAPGAAPIACGTEVCDRLNSTLAGPFPAAVLAGAGKQEDGASVDLPGTYQYLLGKYDAGQAGALVWFFENGISGTIALPATFNGFGLSHTSWYNEFAGDDDDDQDVPEPGTLALLGLGLLGLGLGRRRRNG